jgi:RNAse (barnase) inhibitor barstar
LGKKMASRVPEQSIDVSGVYDDETLHEYLSKTLGFPGYYGWNWDAFWDCIVSDDQSSMPTILRVSGLDELRRLVPESAKHLESCLSDYAAKFPERQVVFE